MRSLSSNDSSSSFRFASRYAFLSFLLIDCSANSPLRPTIPWAFFCSFLSSNATDYSISGSVCSTFVSSLYFWAAFSFSILCLRSACWIFFLSFLFKDLWSGFSASFSANSLCCSLARASALRAFTELGTVYPLLLTAATPSHKLAVFRARLTTHVCDAPPLLLLLSFCLPRVKVPLDAITLYLFQFALRLLQL